MRQQTGAVLAFCLVFLALLAVMAISGMESILLHQRMEANMRLYRDGFEAAEAALREAEDSLGRQCPAVGAAFSEDLPSADAVWRRTAETGPEWWDAHGTDAVFSGAGSNPPRFFVESWRDMSLPPGETIPVHYRISARGEGTGRIGASVLQVVGTVFCSGAQMTAQNRHSWRQLL